MYRFLVEAFFQVIIILPLAMFLVRKNLKENYLRVLVFAAIYVVYQLTLVLPKLYQSLDILGGKWNWTGKLFGIIFGVICYFAFRKFFAENDFFTFKQDRD